MRRILIGLTLGLLVAGIVAWQFWTPSPDQVQAEATPLQHTAVEETLPVRSAPSRQGPVGAYHDPVVVGPCNIFPIAEQDVASPMDGMIREVIAELGQPVSRGQLLARLDDDQLRPQVELLRIKAESRSAELIAQALLAEAQRKVEYAEEANSTGLKAVSDLEYQTYRAQRERYTQEVKKAREEQETAARELERAKKQLALHEIRSALSGEVVKVYKRTGEATRQADPLFRVVNYERLRVEGLCKASQASLLTVGMRARVEPETRGEAMTQLTGHTAPIHGLAMSPNGKLLASAGEDRTVLLWRWPGGRRLVQLPHSSEVYTLAFAPAPDKNGRHRLLTGCADGQVRLWMITETGDVEGPKTLRGAHAGAVRSLAWSGNALRCATGGEDRRVGIWDVEAGCHVYWSQPGGKEQAAHQGAVTSVHFTLDGRLVTAGRDNTLRVWNPGASSAKLEGSHGGRTGDVAQLGISADGTRMLFDHGDELRILARESWDTLGALHNRQHGHFRSLAQFSPSGRLIVTAANNGRLQLWTAPAAPEQVGFLRHGYTQGFHRGSLLALRACQPFPDAPFLTAFAATSPDLPAPRLWPLGGYEARHFVTPSGTATCAVFAPDESVLFTAGTDKVIHVWAVPQASEWEEPLEARLTYVGSEVERGTDMVRVRAELDNAVRKGRRLRPGTSTNLRFYPETAGEASR